MVADMGSRCGLPGAESSMEEIDMLLPGRLVEEKAAVSRPAEKGGGGGGPRDMEAGGLY